MKQEDNKPVHLFKLKDEITIASSKWSLNTILQTERDLHSTICQLKNVYNSKLKINQLHSDILYRVFTIAVQSSWSPLRMTILLRLSHVCQHWRQSALGWPTLWTFLDIDSTPPIFDLFLERSQDAPLTLWMGYTALEEALSTSFFVQHANHILSRLSRLIISSTCIEFPSFYNILKHSGLLPLQLRHFDLQLSGRDHTDDDIDECRALISHIVDGSSLQEFALGGLGLPWPELSLNNITYLNLSQPVTLPTSQFLVFLSNCRFLRVLELNFYDKDNSSHKSTSLKTPPTNLAARKLVLNLTRLKLRARGSLGCEFIQLVSQHIQFSGRLSSFELDYIHTSGAPVGNDALHQTHWHLEEKQGIISTWPLPVPPGTFSHFSNCRFLLIELMNDNHHTNESRMHLNIRGYTSVGDYGTGSRSRNLSPLVISYGGLPGSDYFLILNLLRATPEIRHLRLHSQAWEVLALENLDARNAFPCLHTLELALCTIQGLNSLPTALQVKTLILHDCNISSEVLFDVVLRLKATFLDLVDINADVLEECANAITTLRKRGVCVVKRHSKVSN